MYLYIECPRVNEINNFEGKTKNIETIDNIENLLYIFLTFFHLAQISEDFFPQNFFSS